MYFTCWLTWDKRILFTNSKNFSVSLNELEILTLEEVAQELGN